MFPVQRNVPLPKAARVARRGRRKYPFETMEVGDMFFVPNRSRNTMTPHVSAEGKALGRKFATRLVHMVETKRGWVIAKEDTAGAVQGVGVWRVE